MASGSTGLTRCSSKPGLAGEGAGVVLGVAGDGDEGQVGQLGTGAEGPGDLVAVHVGQADVHEHHVEAVGADRPQGRRAVVNDLNLVALVPQDQSPGSRPIVTLSSTTKIRRPRTWPPGRPSAAATGSGSGAAGTSAGSSRGRRTTNSLPRPRPSLWASTAPSVHLDEGADQGQAEAEPSLRAVERAVGLGEQLEDAGEHRGVDPDAVVADAEDDLVSLDLGREPNTAPVLRCTWRRCAAGSRAPGPSAWGRPGRGPAAQGGSIENR